MKNSKILVLCSIFLITLIFIKGFGLFGSDKSTPVLDDRDIIIIPVSEVSENAKWYKDKVDGIQTEFFAVKTDDGIIKTAFNACDVCYESGKGYRQERDYMVCNNCELRFAISGLDTENKTLDACWPGYFPNTIEDDNIVIKVSDLIKNRRKKNVQELNEVCDLEIGVCPIL